MDKFQNNIRISSEMLSDFEINKLLNGINKSPGFNNFTSKELLRYNKNGRLFGLRSGSKLLGITAIKKIDDQWMEFAVFYIFKKYRSMGFGKTLWTQTMQQILHNNIFLVTSNPRVKRFAEGNHFCKKDFFSLPNVVIKHFIVERARPRKIISFFQKRYKNKAHYRNFSFFVSQKK